MASKRRGGFRPPELRGTLGTLLRTTTDVVRGALERGAREGRARLDDARAHRRRQDALADLGELVLDLIRRGEIDLAELPEARDLIRQLDDFDAEPDDEPEPEPPRPAIRRRFDDRPRRGPAASAASAASATRATRDDDGTVSSGAAPRSTRPTTPGRPRDSEAASTRVPTRPIKGVGRHAPDPTDDVATPSDRPPLRRTPLAPDPHRKGGISFDDDDLNEYMHPDDVPPKPPPRNPGDGDA
jgi:hypothetical protein